MRGLLSTYGSRGDVEPIAGLAVSLRALGAEVRMCVPPDDEFAILLARADLPLIPAFAPVREWVMEVKKRPKTDSSQRAAEIVDIAKGIVAAQYDVLASAADGCDVILATGLFPSVAAAQAVAERSGIRFVCAAFCPQFLPSEHNRPHEFPAHPHPSGVTDNRMLWERDIQTKNTLFGEGINALRSEIGLPVLNNVRDRILTDRPWLASDPFLAPWRQTDLRDVVQTGAWIMPDERPLAAELTAFLEAAEAPVYVGFGSMPMEALQDAARAAIEASRSQGRRVILSHGWAEIAPIDRRDDCFAVGDVNQQALFLQVAAVVHHGGAGTTTTAARAGAPQVIVPQVADQPYWGARVAALGIGAAHDGPQPNFESLSAALAMALAPETRARACALASMVGIDGAPMAAKLLLEGGSS